MNRIQATIERKKRSELRKGLEKDSLENDISKKAEICRKLMADKRHGDYKQYWIDIVTILRSQRDGLINGCNSEFEFMKKSTIIDTQINTINWILNEPEKFIELDNKIKKDGELKND